MRQLLTRWFSRSGSLPIGAIVSLLLASWAQVSVAVQYAPGHLMQLALAGGSVEQVSAIPDDSGSSDYQQLLIGFYVDDIEKTALFALYDGEQYLVPLRRVLEDTGAELVDREGRLVIVSPGGEVVISREELRDHQGILMIRQQALNDLLMMDAKFDPQAYALLVYPPWWQVRAPQAVVRPVITPHYSPPSASLRNMRADFSYYGDDDRNDTWSQYYLSGNLAGGYWSARAERDINDDHRVFDYRWQRETEHSQVLLGNARFSIHPLVPTVDQTGAQLLWNSQPRGAGQGSGIANADGSRQLGSGVRTISGTGQPGSIAELRLSGTVIARTRVRLDGTFEFLDVDMPSRGFSDVKVLLRDRSSGTLLEEIDYSRRGGEGILARGQHTVFASVGEQGNFLDDDIDSRGAAGAMQWRYGVTDSFTAELSHQYDGEEGATVAATSLSFGGSWFGSLAYATNPDVNAAELILNGGRANWQFDLLAREYDGQWLRQADYRYTVSPNLIVGLAGRDSRTTFEDENFLLPTLSWGNGSSLWASARPNTEGNYRVDSRYSPTRRDTLRYTYEDEDHFVDLRRNASNGLEYFATFRGGEQFSSRYEFGVIVRSEDRLLEEARFSLVHNVGGSPGFAVQWDSRPLQGVYSRLRVSDNAIVNAAEDFDAGFTVQWDVTLDYAVSAGRIIPADSSLGGFGSAALVGDVVLDFPGHVEMGDINRISLIVDGVRRTARVQDGKYYVDGLEPGLHKVSLDSRFLPIQLSPASGQQYWVMLESAAATEVPFRLEVGYAVAGRVSMVDGEALKHARVSVLDEQGRSLQTVHTDQFGLYRIDRLPPGRYRIIVEEDGLAVAARSVDIVDEFLFEQDIKLPGSFSRESSGP
jgi:hypothetical protein